MSKYIFTSESVSEGHPDKIADQISDAILDHILEKDPKARVACETMVTTGFAVVAGEVTTKCYIEVPKVVRNTIKNIGYSHSEMGFDFETCGVLVSFDEQSGDIARGVDEASKKEQGAGDQGMMFGYATKETPELMPMPIMYSHKLVRRLAQLRKKGHLPYLRPDSKSQVSVRYENDRPVGIETVVISTQHNPGISNKKMRAEITEQVIPVCGVHSARNWQQSAQHAKEARNQGPKRVPERRGPAEQEDQNEEQDAGAQGRDAPKGIRTEQTPGRKREVRTELGQGAGPLQRQ